MRHLYFFLLTIFISTNFIFAQTDNTFWFAAPDVSGNHCGSGLCHGKPIRLHITAVNATTVTISRPADNDFTPITFDLTALEHKQIRLDDFAVSGLYLNEIETYTTNDINTPSTTGFLIESDPGQITCYYELDNSNNRDIFPLKGANALGTDFYISTQNQWDNAIGTVSERSGLVIVATADNTTVNVTHEMDFMYFGGPDTETVTLDKGETFDFRANTNNAAGHIMGVHVTSDNPIAITLYDDSVYGSYQSCYDILGDQTIPVDLLGKEYIAIEGYLNFSDEVYVTAINDNTEVFFEEVSQGTIDEGESMHISLPYGGDVANYIRATDLVYVNHITGFGCEIGGAVLPTIENCTGSHDVTFVRTTSDDFYLNIMVRNDTTSGSTKRNESVKNFVITANGTSDTIPSEYFDFIMDSAFAVLNRESATISYYTNIIQGGTEVRVSNSVSRFHLGIINGGAATGCKYGYFSDYAASQSDAGIQGANGNTDDVFCGLSPILLVAEGGSDYLWELTTVIDSGGNSVTVPASDVLDDVTASSPYFTPPYKGYFEFKVDVSDDCFSTTYNLNIFVANQPITDFDLSASEGCTPFNPLITNTSQIESGDTTLPVVCSWVINGTAVNQDTLPRSFYWEFPENNSDSIKEYLIKLTSYGDDVYSCPSTKQKTIKVYPKLTADFYVEDTAGCHPFEIQISDSSSGHITDSGYYWEFGDNSQSYELEPEKTYYNYSYTDTVFNLQLITESPYGCTDTASQEIVVYPRVRATFAIDTAQACSPMVSHLDPKNSVGVDSFFYHIDYAGDSTMYIATDEKKITIEYSDSTIANGPDTILINLVAKNDYGCVDTFPEKRIIAFPIVDANIWVSDTAICDSLPIIFNDSNSIGNNLYFEWEFGDGTIRQDSMTTHTKYYFNRTNKDTIYQINLTAVSEYFCEATDDTTITVHPYIKAGLGLYNENNCAPLNAVLSNSTIRGHYFEWDMGDGYGFTTNSDTGFAYTYNNYLDYSDTNYTIILKAKNNEGCWDSIKRTINIFPQIVSEFVISDTIGCSPLQVEFRNRSKGSLNYDWNFGDQSTGYTTDTVFTHKYTNNWENDTSFIISLRTSNSQGCDSITYDTITVMAAIDASFDLQTKDSCSPFTVRTLNYSSESCKNFDWYINDTLYSNDYSIARSFKNIDEITDTISVKLIAYGIDDSLHFTCADVDSDVAYIYPNLTIDFELDPSLWKDSLYASCQPFTSEVYNNTVLKNGTYFWWYLDGIYHSNDTVPDDDLEIANREDVDSLHTIKLIGRSQDGCRDTLAYDIMVYSHVKSLFVVDNPALCSYQTLEVDATGSEGGLKKFDLEIDGFTPAISDSILYSYDFPANTTDVCDTHTISLTVSNEHQCDSTWTEEVISYPELTAAFELDNEYSLDATHYAGCQPFGSDITNNTFPKPGTEYTWKLGTEHHDAGSGSDLADPLYIENNITSDDLVDTLYLYAKSKYNCKDTAYAEITVFPYIEAFFTTDKTGYCAYEDVVINSENTKGNVSKHWDYGNGDEDDELDPEFIHPYDHPGSESVKEDITITLDINHFTHTECTDTYTRTISLYPEFETGIALVGDGITGNAGTGKIDYAYEGCQPFTSEMLNNSSPNSGPDFTWQLDDVYISDKATPDDPLSIQNTTDASITDTITLTGITEYGCKDTSMVTATAFRYVKAHFTTSDPSICSDDSILFNRGLSRGGVGTIPFTWYYDDEEEVRSDVEFYKPFYNDDGKASYDKIPVSLIVVNSENCSDTMTKTITVFPKVVADFTVDDSSVCFPHTSVFTNYTTNASEYSWSFGDGNSSDETDPEHIFENYDRVNDETYSIRLIAQSAYNCFDSTRKNITVLAKPNAEFYFPVTADCPPFNAQMINTSIGSGLTYNWDFAGLDSSTMENPSYVFDNQNSSSTISPQVTLIVTSDKECKDTLKKTLNVYPSVDVSYTSSHWATCSPQEVDLLASDENADELIWYLDGTAFSTLAETSYRLNNETANTDSFQVVLYGKSIYECFDYDTNYITLYPTPEAEFDPDPLISEYNKEIEGTKVEFYNETPFVSNWMYTWDFGDGNTSDEASQSFTHQFAEYFWGDKDDDFKVPVSLTAWNTEHPECEDYVEHNIYINPPYPDVELPEDIAGCVPFTADFSSFTDYTDGTYQWSFGDESGTYTDETLSHTFTTAGTYTVKLLVEGDGGQNWDYQIVTVYPQPITDFSFNDSSVFVASQTEDTNYVSFFNHTKYGDKYYWFFDSEDIYNGLAAADAIDKEPIWAYSEVGEYYPALVAESEYGCLDTMVSTIAIHVHGTGSIEFPNAFFVDPSSPESSTYSDQTKSPSLRLFRPYAKGVETYKLEIYNRWGVKVFESFYVFTGWNGFINGVPAKQDVYIYRVKGKFSNGQPFEMAGDVTLIYNSASE